MALPDNRLRFPTTRIDFATDVGETGQDHDNWPSAGAIPRYDWMRIWLIALLSNQSGAEEPTEYRIGSIWYDTDNDCYKYYDGTNWQELSKAIKIDESTLYDLLNTAAELVTELKSDLVFSGRCISNSVTLIPIPESLLPKVSASQHHPLVYVNGLLLDHRKSSIKNDNMIELTESLSSGDRFTIVLQNILTTSKITSDITV